MAVEWSEKLATGNDDIDNQHKELFRRFNNLLDACHQRKGKEEVSKLILFLGDYVRTHFSMEESLQKRCSFPGYSDHKKQHDGFIHDLKKLEQQFNLEGATLLLVIQTNQTMMDWLINHINSTDKKFAEYLRTGA
ncbi:MAG: hemerythrin [Geobacter sp.]|nr:MAG: hemerythrin [Geobacter sp.]